MIHHRWTEVMKVFVNVVTIVVLLAMVCSVWRTGGVLVPGFGVGIGAGQLQLIHTNRPIERTGGWPFTTGSDRNERGLQWGFETKTNAAFGIFETVVRIPLWVFLLPALCYHGISRVRGRRREEGD